jgi:hypothetical protein
MGRERVLVSFVDNERREIYGQRYLDGVYDRLEEDVRAYAAATFASLRAATFELGSDVPARQELDAALHEKARQIVGVLPGSVP